jgi:cellulose biosynthesis protein BcsQ
VAADLVLTPIELDEFSKNNLNLVVIELNKVANMVGKDDIYQKVLVNRLKRTKDQFLHFSDLINNHDYPVLPVSISERAAINTALTLHKPMYMHRKNCIATRDFEDVTELLMTTLGIKGRRI